MEVPDTQESVEKVIWDAHDWGVFVTADITSMQTYIHSPLSISGPQTIQLGILDIQPNGDMVVEPRPTPMPPGASPIMVFNGQVTSQTLTGSLVNTTLITHETIATVSVVRATTTIGKEQMIGLRFQGGRVTPERLRAQFAQYLSLLRLHQAWEVAKQLNNRSFWLALSGKAMEMLEVELAMRVYRELGDAGKCRDMTPPLQLPFDNFCSPPPQRHCHGIGKAH